MYVSNMLERPFIFLILCMCLCLQFAEKKSKLIEKHLSSLEELIVQNNSQIKVALKKKNEFAVQFNLDIYELVCCYITICIEDTLCLWISAMEFIVVCVKHLILLSFYWDVMVSMYTYNSD